MKMLIVEFESGAPVKVLDKALEDLWPLGYHVDLGVVTSEDRVRLRIVITAEGTVAAHGRENLHAALAAVRDATIARAIVVQKVRGPFD